MESSHSLTPMMQQFFDLKNQNPGFLLFFRLGDFYEMFDEDARVGSKILGLTLTKRQQFDMCGIPHHAKDNYLHKLVRANIKVAICEQVEVINGTKRSFERKITEILTPGTFHNEKFAEKDGNSFLMSLFFFKKVYYFALADVSTGELFFGQAQTQEHLASQIYRSMPAEILAPASQKDAFEPFLRNLYHSFAQDRWFTNPEEEFLKTQFHTRALSSVELDNAGTQGVVFAALQYLRQNLFKDIVHLDSLKKISTQNSLWMSDSTIQNLDLIATSLRGGDAKYSLYSQLNQTKTPVGARYLRQLITAPLMDIEHIEDRLNKVEYFLSKEELVASIRDVLNSLPDFSRLISKLSLKTANPKDTWAMKGGLDKVEQLWNILPEQLCQNFISYRIQDSLLELRAYINSSLTSDPPATIEGEAVFQETYSPELDKLRKNSTQSYQVLLDIEKREREKNNLPKLRIKYNKILGYYMELPKVEAQRAPSYFIRKQTLSNLERFTIEELLNFEALVLSSKEKLVEMERELFQNFCEKILEWLPNIQGLVSGICELDIVTTFAYISLRSQYIRPQVLADGPLEILDGRHPVVEKYAAIFTPNSLYLDDYDSRLWIISGPNMAGKSTFLRQCAIIVLMSHMGCFVPASRAKIPLTDQIFTRVGSSDNLAKGESTFLVEMAEASAILNFSTRRSLVIMDELGRGTSTNDGLALCWSIIEYLCDSNHVRGKILFSTHYHELASLEKTLRGVKNYQMSVQETDTDIVFLHKIEHGAATRSYGIHVASLAGLPKAIIQRAQSILALLDQKSRPLVEEVDNGVILPATSSPQADKVVISSTMTNILESMKTLDLDRMTGIEALLLLQKWKKKYSREHLNSTEDSILF